MGASNQFHDAVSGQYNNAAPQVSHEGSNAFYFHDQAAAAYERSPPKPCKPFSTVPFPPDPYFVDRPDILNWMDEKCTRPATCIALVGLGGIGKSQIAIRYAHHVRQHSPNTWVFWVHASTRGRFEEAYKSIADRLELPGRNDPNINILRLVCEWLRVEENGRWMMILDSADDANVLFSATSEQLASFLPRSSNGSIIVTSRSLDVAERLVGSRSNLQVVPAMRTEEACQLLHEKLQVGYEAGAAVGLVHALDHVPLAITQAAAYINRRAPRMSISAYLDEFCKSDKKRANLLNRDAGDLRRDESASNSIMTTWQITFEQIRRERPSAADLLSFMSFFNPQGIPESILRTYARDDGEDGEEDLDEDLDEDLEVLRGYSLVAVTAESDIFEMHALVQFCTRVWLSLFGDMQHWEREFLRVMSDRYPSGRYENWTECQRLDPHIAVIVKKEPDDSGDALRWARLLVNAGWYRWMRGRYNEVEQMNRRALEVREKVLGREHPDTLTSVGILASVLRDLGKYEESEQMNRRVLEAREKVLGREHPDTLTSVSNLASVLQNQGKYEEAEQMNRRALEVREEVLGREHPDTLTSVGNLASVLQNQGKYEEAEQMNRRALYSREKMLGREHPDTLVSIRLLASVLQQQGKYEESEQMNRRTLYSREKVLGREHPDTLTSVSNLASVLQNQGKYEEAEQMNRRALEVREEVLGREHPDTLTSVGNLASVLQNQGKYEEAEQMNRRALYSREKVLGREHPDTLTSVSNLASVLQNQGKYEEAEQINRRALYSREKVLGREHPGTLNSMANLASIFWDQGRWEEAEELQMRVMETMKRVLGEEHPDALTNMANLASTYSNQGRWNEAEGLQVRVMETRKRVLGEAHPHTLTSMADMAATWKGLHQRMKAKALLENCFQLRRRVLGPNHPDTRYALLTLHEWNSAKDGFQVPETGYSDIADSETSNSLWSNREGLTDPSSQSHEVFASQDQVTESRPTMTFFNYEKSEAEKKFGKMDDDDFQSIVSISSDIDSLAEPNSAMATFRHAAVTYVVSMLTRNPELLTLYKEATQSMGEAKFVRNHRRLLKEYFLELRADGQTPSQRAAIEFLRFRHNRTQISHGICNLTMPSNNAVQEQVSAMLKQEKDNLIILDRFLGERNSVEPPAPSETVGKLPHRKPGTQHLALEDADNASEGSDDSDDDGGIDDQYRYQFEEGSLLSNLEATADFFTTGRPFRVYQDHLREFLNPTHVSTESSGIPRPDLYALRAPDAGMAKIYRKIWTFLSVIGLREHDIAPGHQRVRWKNRRGKPLYDDYVEHEPGALQALQAYLNSSAYRSRTSSSRGNGHESAISAPSDSSNSSVQASTSQSGDRADQARSPPGHARISRFREDLEMGELSGTSLHLLSCMELRRHAVVLHPELVTHITDDRHLFRTLRNSYHEHRGKLRGYCSLRTIHAIHFMKFAYGGRRYIDVRCHHEICEQGKPCNCLPPAGLVRPNGSEYECSPVPSKFSPPIGARLMMDFFTNPDDIEPDSTLVLRQLPKWTGGNLQTPRAEVVEAWGIYYKEDWDWTKIWWILGIGFFPPSLLFGILWGILKQDIQGAFGVASWWMAGATIVVGIVGTSTWAV
ncbi:hypothetical protein NCS57_00840200 [Fusarium keratoplasticum]|uniref:Uncharacterized protein n=1 Tax=Fusarium keratoplasticum TaxID=1328300 RepID=A0ACC0QU48_9HYPO|nr:hypothetical protein NCS57_00840200 [Fusarium keratoplasticum]KAI8666162.1 hypothetical protein NCS57_00840200 [Fusarium keratoplasticum]